MSGISRDETSPWKHRLRSIAAELSRLVALRRELAALEIAHDRRLLKRSAILGGIGALIAIIGLGLLVQATALQLAADFEVLSEAAWTAIIGAVLLVPGAFLLLRVYRRIRTGFCGLHGTLSELNEDLVWLREWTQSEMKPEGNASGDETPA